LFDVGFTCAMLAATAFMFSLAAASATPGFSRPMASRKWKSWLICSISGAGVLSGSGRPLSAGGTAIWLILVSQR
jgi:hypothetical protein